MKIAVVGGGVAGIVSSYLLSQQHEVTIFEAGEYLGGHTNSRVIESGPDAGTAVDTGFIVLNTKNYPTLHKFLKRIDVPVRFADMSFAYYCEATGFQYAGTTLNGLFAQRSNIVSGQFYKFLWELKRFCMDSAASLERGELGAMRLADLVERGRYSQFFVDSYLLPMGAAIWSAPLSEILEFPAQTFVQFFKNHGLLGLRDRPRWQTIVGGSSSYVKKFQENFPGTIKLRSPVASVQRSDTQVTIVTADGEKFGDFDAVVMAAHADQTLRMLETPTAEEQRLLGAWGYENNYTVLHTDTRLLPSLKRAWASWNYTRFKSADAASPVAVTYHMNRLQGLRSKTDYCVTLNCREISDKNIVYATTYTHPTFNSAAVATQPELPKLQGVQRTYFCGSYFGYGFHEDAAKSGVEVARKFSIDL